MQQEISVFETSLLNLQTPVQRVLATSWFVNSSLKCHELYQKLSSFALPGDRFIVIAASECAYDNLIISSGARVILGGNSSWLNKKALRSANVIPAVYRSTQTPLR